MSREMGSVADAVPGALGHRHRPAGQRRLVHRHDQRVGTLDAPRPLPRVQYSDAPLDFDESQTHLRCEMVPQTALQCHSGGAGSLVGASKRWRGVMAWRGVS